MGINADIKSLDAVMQKRRDAIATLREIEKSIDSIKPEFEKAALKTFNDFKAGKMAADDFQKVLDGIEKAGLKAIDALKKDMEIQDKRLDAIAKEARVLCDRIQSTINAKSPAWVKNKNIEIKKQQDAIMNKINAQNDKYLGPARAQWDKREKALKDKAKATGDKKDVAALNEFMRAGFTESDEHAAAMKKAVDYTKDKDYLELEREKERIKTFMATKYPKYKAIADSLVAYSKELVNM